MADSRHSAFGEVDQQAILANLDLVHDDPVESDFFAAEMPTDAPDLDGPPGLLDDSPAGRRDFILYGPAGVGVAQ